MTERESVHMTPKIPILFPHYHPGHSWRVGAVEATESR